MNRSKLCIATAFLALPTLFASTAQACISCEYTPEVVRSSSTTYEGPGSYSHQRAYAVERVERVERSRPARHIARQNDDDKPAKAKAQTARVTPTAPAVEQVATTEPVKIEQKPTQNENSSISIADAKVATTESAPVVEPVKEEVAAAPTGCKKFFAAVGMTVSVPCE